MNRPLPVRFEFVFNLALLVVVLAGGAPAIGQTGAGVPQPGIQPNPPCRTVSLVPKIFISQADVDQAFSRFNSAVDTAVMNLNIPGALYCLSGPIQDPRTPHARSTALFEIAADSVTLDFDGHEVNYRTNWTATQMSRYTGAVFVKSVNGAVIRSGVLKRYPVGVLAYTKPLALPNQSLTYERKTGLEISNMVIEGSIYGALVGKYGNFKFTNNRSNKVYEGLHYIPSAFAHYPNRIATGAPPRDEPNLPSNVKIVGNQFETGWGDDALTSGLQVTGFVQPRGVYAHEVLGMEVSGNRLKVGGTLYQIRPSASYVGIQLWGIITMTQSSDLLATTFTRFHENSVEFHSSFSEQSDVGLEVQKFMRLSMVRNQVTSPIAYLATGIKVVDSRSMQFNLNRLCRNTVGMELDRRNTYVSFSGNASSSQRSVGVPATAVVHPLNAQCEAIYPNQ